MHGRCCRCERLLKSMYYVTLRLGAVMPWQTELLWGTLARSKRNIIPILDFLTSLGMDTAHVRGGSAWVNVHN